ncbi:MAG: methyltransferase domain-containing protein, partial [Halobacteriales archaeon]|nr:methyltransferase domain-containing protein [Halobacteriales archaeon]
HAHHGGDDAHHHDRHHSFDNPEDYVDRWNSPERDAWQKPDEVISLMDIEPGMTVADLGAGTGYFLEPLSDAVGPEGVVWGLDIEEAMVDYMAKAAAKANLNNVKTKKVEAENPGVTGVDRFLVVNVWHHIAGREAYAGELASALRAGGKVIIVDFSPDGEEGWGPPREIRLEASEVVSELEAGGFDAEVADESLPRQYVVVATKR